MSDVGRTYHEWPQESLKVTPEQMAYAMKLMRAQRAAGTWHEDMA